MIAPPLRAVWELTWRCNLRCTHCLVEGGPNDKVELDTDEGLALIDALAELGVAQVTLTGGEPLMRKDWSRFAERLTHHRIRTVLSTNGHLITEKVIETLLAVDLWTAVLSFDGLAETHDRVRRFPEASARRSSFQEVVAAIGRLQAARRRVAIITAVDAGNIEELPALHAAVKDLGVHEWMVQLAHPTGRMDDAATLPPARIPELIRFLVAAAADPVLPPVVHSTIGWLSKEEPILRSSGRRHRAVWTGTPCGVAVVGIEPDGGVKGCPNQVGAPFVVGNVRTEPLRQIWEDRGRWFWVRPDPALATGTCAPCGLKAVCGGGCPCISYASTGHLFDNPYCARALARP